MKSDEMIILSEMLVKVTDSRHDRGIRYRLCDLLLLSIYSSLAGYTTASDMEYYTELNFEYFKQVIGLAHVPSHDTFSRIMRITDFKALTDVLNEWLEEYYPEVYKKYGNLNIIHVDGKAVRGASEKSNGEKPKYLLNAMYEGGTIRIESEKIGDKENEISRLPDFLKLFNLEEALVTIDAMGNNNTVIKAITEQKGNYLTIVKENQSLLLDAIKNEEERMKKEQIVDKDTGETISEYDTLESFEITNKGHGRIDTYKATAFNSMSFITKCLKENDLYSSIGRVFIYEKESTHKENGKEVKVITKTYIITSLEGMSPEKAIEIKRSHWNIEMQHWILDVELLEDRSTARKDNSIQNMSTLKRFAMRIKKQHKEFEKLSMRKFGMYCEHNPENITKLLFC